MDTLFAMRGSINYARLFLTRNNFTFCLATSTTPPRLAIICDMLKLRDKLIHAIIIEVYFQLFHLGRKELACANFVAVSALGKGNCAGQLLIFSVGSIAGAPLESVPVTGELISTGVGGEAGADG